MRLSYGGIEFQVLKMEDWTREAVFDSLAGADYLYDRHLITCVCLLNEGYTDVKSFPSKPPERGAENTELQSYIPYGKPSGTPWNNILLKPNGNKVVAPAIQPPVKATPTFLSEAPTGPAPTLVELFKRLRKQRQQLRVWIDGGSLAGDLVEQNVLLSPLPDFEEDCLHGPTCNIIQPISLGANTTVALRLQFETHIPGCTGTNAPIMVSNRWSYTVSADEDYYAIHKIDGEAKFRMDLLHRLGMSADQFREQFMHPIPIGFRREQPTVTLLPGGDTVAYTIIDRQMPLSFPGGIPFGATRIEIDEAREYKSPLLF